jgi:hypothetical protein
VRKMAEMEEKEWVASVDKWNAEVDRREWMGDIAKAVAKPVRVQGRCPSCRRKLANSMQMGVVLGRLGGDRTDCEVGARNITEHVLY